MRAQIYLRVSMNGNFIIPLNGLATGKNESFWKVDKEFFESFENSEILDAELSVSVLVEKSGRYIGVDCDICGSVTVECDRCLDDLVLPVDTEVRLSVKFGEEEPSEEHAEGEREVVFVSQTEAELDMSQIVYDYICLSLPLQRVHEEGECNPEVMARLSGEESSAAREAADSPFASLKGLF